MTLHDTNFDLYQLLDDVVNMLRPLAEEKQLRLLLERVPNVPQYVRTDKAKLRQILLNLLNNAIKFTEEGGVSVRVKRVDEFHELKSAETQKLFFEIEDSGPGISPEEIETLFTAFVQTETGRNIQEGTGLGLSISQKFVDLMGGNLTARSQVGHGTLFMFDIRLNVVRADDIEQPPVKSPGCCPGSESTARSYSDCG